MKTKIMIIALTILFAFTSVAFSGQKDKRNNKGKKNQRHGYSQQDRGHGKHKRYDARSHHDDRKWRKHHKHRRHHIPDYHRHRHWKRWGDWDRHYRHNHHKYKGGYYHNDKRGNLMFTHCQDERNSSTCISFGIYF